MAELSPKQKEYRAFFNKLLDKHGVGSPSELDEAGKKKFYNEVDEGWTQEKVNGANRCEINAKLTKLLKS